MTILKTVAFSDGENGGNPCCIIFDDGNLSSDQMLAITQYFGFESLFISASVLYDVQYKFRYFVPQHEMEMCVHATIAGATFLLENNLIKEKQFQIETLLGKITVGWRRNEDHTIIVTVKQFPPRFAANNPTKHEIAACLNIDEAAIDTTDFPIQSVSTSRSKLIIPIVNDVQLHNLKPNFKKLWKLCDQYGTTGFYPFSLQTGSQHYDFEARQFPNNVGYNEDAATGVAACALGAYLTEYSSKVDFNAREIIIGQGKAMNRPSKIIVKTSKTKDLTTTEVSGTAQIFGTENLPREVYRK